MLFGGRCDLLLVCRKRYAWQVAHESRRVEVAKVTQVWRRVHLLVLPCWVPRYRGLSTHCALLKQPGRPVRASSASSLCRIHPSAWKVNCANFAITGFSEGRRFLCALERIHFPRPGVWCLRCVAC